MPVKTILAAIAVVLVLAPLALGVAGWLRARRESRAMPPVRMDWRLAVASTLLYVLAFNLVFFLQELFLVLPKALTPGLRATLYHNNHTWTGDNPVAALFQGTGVVATLLAGLGCLAWLRSSRAPRAPAARLFLAWMAYCGCLMALPQVVAGALLPGSDVGMAMGYLQLGVATKTTAALLALAAIPAVALALRRPLLEFADDAARIDHARARTRFAFHVATLPALAAIALIVPFRVPRDPVEVLVVPLVVSCVGIAWIQAGAWRVDDARASGSRIGGIGWIAAAAVALLLVFQLVLRPGIAFG
jgi:hypothetical protein